MKNLIKIKIFRLKNGPPFAWALRSCGPCGPIVTPLAKLGSCKWEQC